MNRGRLTCALTLVCYSTVMLAILPLPRHHGFWANERPLTGSRVWSQPLTLIPCSLCRSNISPLQSSQVFTSWTTPLLKTCSVLSMLPGS